MDLKFGVYFAKTLRVQGLEWTFSIPIPSPISTPPQEGRDGVQLLEEVDCFRIADDKDKTSAALLNSASPDSRFLQLL
jgi:hypothetical protein